MDFLYFLLGLPVAVTLHLSRGHQIIIIFSFPLVLIMKQISETVLWLQKKTALAVLFYDFSTETLGVIQCPKEARRPRLFALLQHGNSGTYKINTGS